MDIPEILAKRLRGSISDSDAMDALMRTGENEADARELLQIQDTLMGRELMDWKPA